MYALSLPQLSLNLAVYWALQIFVTPDTLYLVLWSLAKQPQPGQDAAAHRIEMIQELAKWATLLQTCSPGAKVQLVGSHKDEVADEALVAEQCRWMAAGVHAELSTYRETQQRELDQLSLMQDLSPHASERKRQLQRVLSRPLRLAEHALAVSAKSLAGMEELRAAMVEAAAVAMVVA